MTQQDPSLDYAIGIVGISAPVWLPELNVWLNTIIALGGVILVGRRLYVAFSNKEASMANMNKDKFNKLRREPVVLKEPVAEVVKEKAEAKPKAEAPKKRGRPKGSVNKKA